MQKSPKMESAAGRSLFKSLANHLQNVETYCLIPHVKSNLNLRHKTNSIGTIKLSLKSKVKLYKLSASARIPTRSNNYNDQEEGEEEEEGNSKLRNVLTEGRGWIHFVGVGGSGLSALAMLALKQGFEVSGSDIAWSNYMDLLKAAGGRLFVGHSELNLRNPGGLSFPDAIVMSSAIPPDNVEILYAKSAGVPVFKRGPWLQKLTEKYNLIAVSGSHGKSTTTSMITYVLRAMGDDLTAIMGAQVPQFSGMNAIYGTTPTFILEADEYDGCFLELSPHINWEHVDIFHDEEIYRKNKEQGASDFMWGQVHLLCLDTRNWSLHLVFQMALNSLGVTKLHSNSYRVTRYGIPEINEWHASSICSNSQGGTDFKLCHRGHPLADIRLQIPGVHNVLNSLAVIATVGAVIGERHFYESIGSIELHLNNFRVSAVVQAARQKFPHKEILVIFQPHTYSRLAMLKNGYTIAFLNADHVIVTEIYAARETNLWNVSARDLAVSMKGPSSEFIPSPMDGMHKLLVQMSEDPNPELVILTLGAGDVTIVGRKLFHELQKLL